MTSIDYLKPTPADGKQGADFFQFHPSDFQILKNLDAAKSCDSLPRISDAGPDIKEIDLSKAVLTTPAEDASAHRQPDYYLNSQGKLIKNPLAKPSPDGKVTIEVEGNNSARKAEQYANKLQKQTIQYLVEMYKRSHPGEKIPEMWQSILDSTPDSSFPNDGDSRNNNTVSPRELESYNDQQSAPGSQLTPEDSRANVSPQPREGTPGAGPGEQSRGSGTGGSPGADCAPSGASSGGSSDRPNQVYGDGGAATDGLQLSSGSMANYDGNPDHMSDCQRAIVAEAVRDIGQSMWGGWANAGATANLGCAASVSQILNDCGAANLHNAHDDNCDGLQADLLAQGWTITDKPQPGDVWIGRGGASEAHTGIVGENNTLMNNHSDNGRWSVDPGGNTGQWTHSVFLKPPENRSSNHLAI
jgi:hypothetical protein